MADPADIAGNNIDQETQRAIDNIPKFDEGVQGTCDLCGEWSGRLIKAACAPCRDKYGLD